VRVLGAVELGEPFVSGPQLRETRAGEQPRVNASVVRRAEGDHRRDLGRAVAPQIRTSDEPAHAVADDRNARRARLRENRVDLPCHLLGEELDRCERRAVGDRVQGPRLRARDIV
jgi:hypothetical protein